MIFSHWAGKVSVRTQRYRLDHERRLVRHAGRSRARTTTSPRQPSRWRRGLSEAVARWSAEVAAGPGQSTTGRSRSAIPISRSRSSRPATASPHGGIQRSSQAPNCSYFTNWTSPDDRITWDVAVETPGRYEAVVYYTCPAADVGSTVELSLKRAAGSKARSSAGPRSAAARRRARPRPAQGRIVRERFQAAAAGRDRTPRGPRPADAAGAADPRQTGHGSPPGDAHVAQTPVNSYYSQARPYP